MGNKKVSAPDLLIASGNIQSRRVARQASKAHNLLEAGAPRATKEKEKAKAIFEERVLMDKRSDLLAVFT